MASPLLEQAKIQAQVLVPLLRAFRAELGTERANRIAWTALAEWRRQIAHERHAGLPGTPADRWMAGLSASAEYVGDAVDVEMHAPSADRVEFDVVGCRFAQFFRELGEPELGFALLCAMDDTVAAEIGAGEVALERTGTIMQGADRCDFRYALKRTGA